MALSTISLLLALSIPLQGVDNAAGPQTLAAMRGHYRPLLVFASDAQQSAAQKQLLFSHRAELLGRNVMLVFFLHKYAGFWDSAIAMNPVGEGAALRRRFHVSPDEFTVLLIGKDGGEKFRSHSPVTMEQLNRIIDAMPMRRQEMRSRNTP